MFDILCFSHLRWDLVFQRPQQLLSRCAKRRRVFYVEEARCGADRPQLEVEQRDGVHVIVMSLPDGSSSEKWLAWQRTLLQQLFTRFTVTDYVQWFYTPMALPLAAGLPPALACVYDCMDELSGFKGAPPGLCELERQLFERADLVFTGGHSLYEAKRELHHNIHPFPSSVDRAHFARARRALAEPADQATIARPRLGFFGVIDERMDLELLAAVARRRPDWQLVMVGPVVKLEQQDLPHLPNIHYLGAKSYAELPAYVAGWDVALMPFAKNDATRFIIPTKTPEYLAAGKPVVSTSIRDVVRPYSVKGLAHIADTPLDFVEACESCLREPRQHFLHRADAFLSHLSWDQTWTDMEMLLEQAVAQRDGSQPYVTFQEKAREVG
jgi:UDP-galactopyranose mutase